MELRHVAVVSSGRELINETVTRGVTETRERKSAYRINSGAISEVQERENGAERRARITTWEKIAVSARLGMCASRPESLSSRYSCANALLRSDMRCQASAYRFQCLPFRFNSLPSIYRYSYHSLTHRCTFLQPTLSQTSRLTRVTNFHLFFASGILFIFLFFGSPSSRIITRQTHFILCRWKRWERERKDSPREDND